MFSVTQETDDSTAVNFCTYGKFLRGDGRQLLTVSGRFLRLFRVNPYALVPPTSENVEWVQRTKLECVYSNRFLSRIQSLATARLPQYPEADAIIMAFDDGKLSIVAMHSGTQQLITISLHNFETEVLKGGYTKNFAPPVVRADHNSRCAAMLLYGKHLAVLPFQEGKEFIHSFVLPLSKIDPRLENVVDMVFLEGYYEPTLMFLYEPLQTTAGRACVRNDTMCTMAVSINIYEKQIAVVWNQAQLPLDTDRIYSVPKPLGGALIVGANEIIYLSQAAPPCGVSVNSCFDGGYTRFPLRDQKHLSVALDASHTTYIGEGYFLIVSKDGEVYSLQLITDSAFNAKSMNITKIAECSLPYCMTRCAKGHVFLGSRLGDSQLLEYKLSEVVVETLEYEPTEQDENEQMDAEDFELYGETTVKTKEVSRATKELVVELRELDRLPNVGPIRAMTPGFPAKLSEAFEEQKRADPAIDFVAASGQSKDGALCIFQRTIRPEVVTSFSIENAQNIWAVGRCEDDSHKYVIVARTRSTLVLELGGEDMVELDAPLFITDDPTVAAGELADGAIAVQVTPLAICLVAEDLQVQLIELDSLHPVMTAAFCDPWIVLLTQDGRLLIYALEMEETGPQLKLNELTPEMKADFSGKITAMSIYKDLSGLMIAEEEDEIFGRPMKGKAAQDVEMADDMDDLYGDMDEEDRLLYGISAAKSRGRKQADAAARKKKRLGEVQAASGGEESDVIDPNTVAPTFWFLVAHDDGRLSIYELPSLRVVFQCYKFGTQLPLLVDATPDEVEAHLAALKALQEKENLHSHGQRAEERVAELYLGGMGFNQGRPTLFMLVDDSVLAYEAFRHKNVNPGHLSIRFRRLPQTLIVRASPFVGKDGRKAKLQQSSEETHRQLFYPFDRIGNVMNGLFIAGPLPHLFVSSPAVGLLCHSMTIDGGIKSFSGFNNWNNPMGYVYLNHKDAVRISKLQPEMNYEASYPVRKLPLGHTPHFVRYLFHAEVYALVQSKPHRSDRICVVVNEERTIETKSRPETFVLPEVEEFTLQLISPVDWQPIYNAEVKMQEMEVVTCCEEVVMRSESTITGFENYVAAGTVCNYGEEVLIRGRLLLYEIIEVIPEPGKPTSNRQLKVLYDKEQKGPVTSICSSNGYLYTGMGQKVFIWQFRDGQMNGMAFIDLDYYIHNLVALKNFVLACDVYASVHLLRYQERFKALSVVCKDVRKDSAPPMSSSFLINDKHASVVMGDETGNVFVLEPNDKEGLVEKMPVRSHFNAGTVINSWIRMRGQSNLCADVADIAQQIDAQSLFYGSLDGSFGFIRPIKERTFRRLNFLSQIMQEEVPCPGGLHPIGARSARPIPENSERVLIDLDFINQFMHLSSEEKKDLARKLGANRYHIMDDLNLIKKLVTVL